MLLLTVIWGCLLLLVPGRRLEAQSIAVPEGDGRPVMTDGIFEPGEWGDAERLVLGDSVALLVKELGGHVFIGVVCGGLGKPSAVNLLIRGAGREIHEMHTSAQIGERVLSSEGEPDPPFVWGSSPRWYANEVRWDQAMVASLANSGVALDEARRRALFPYDGFEFQIHRGKFQGEEWLMRLEVVAPPDFDSPFVYPAGTARKNTEGWVLLRLPAAEGPLGLGTREG